ncbi:MAG: DUF2849 domain-containing protein [Hyphomonas sp.]
MTSVRPKLKPDTPKAVTAWSTHTGRSVWMRADGSWSESVREAAPFRGEEAEARLAEATAQEAVVTDPYFMEVTESGGIAGRETVRETIRATGPTFIFGDGI